MTKTLFLFWVTIAFSTPTPTPTPTQSPISSPAPSPAPTVPYWKAKPEVFKKMLEERYIAVSAHTGDVDKQKKLTVVAAGVIHAPVDFTHERILEYDLYPKFVPYIVESPYDKTTHNIFLHGAFMGWHVHMTIHTEVEKTPSGEKINWKTISGNFVGMTGVITENKIDDDHTEIALDSLYVGPSLGIPAFILDWGLEFSAQRAAGAMRSHIESEWGKSKKH